MIHIKNLHLTINVSQHLPVPEASVLSPGPDIEDQLRNMLKALDMVTSLPLEEDMLTPVVNPLVGAAKDRAVDDLFEKLRVYHWLAARGIHPPQ